MLWDKLEQDFKLIKRHCFIEHTNLNNRVSREQHKENISVLCASKEMALRTNKTPSLSAIVMKRKENIGAAIQ